MCATGHAYLRGSLTCLQPDRLTLPGRNGAAFLKLLAQLVTSSNLAALRDANSAGCTALNLVNFRTYAKEYVDNASMERFCLSCRGQTVYTRPSTHEVLPRSKVVLRDRGCASRQGLSLLPLSRVLTRCPFLCSQLSLAVERGDWQTALPAFKFFSGLLESYLSDERDHKQVTNAGRAHAATLPAFTLFRFSRPDMLSVRLE